MNTLVIYSSRKFLHYLSIYSRHLIHNKHLISIKSVVEIKHNLQEIPSFAILFFLSLFFLSLFVTFFVVILIGALF